MFKTLEVFQAEWFELKSKGKLNEEDLSNVPDVQVKNETLHDLVKTLRNELDTAKSITEKTKDTWEKLRKERDFHKIHHRRVQQEKTKLTVDIDRLKKLHDTYEERQQSIVTKQEMSTKEKMLTKLERDRLFAKVEQLNKTIEKYEAEEGMPEMLTTKQTNKTRSSIRKTKYNNDSAWPTSTKRSTITPKMTETFNISTTIQLAKTFTAHSMAVSSIAMHPRKPVLATVSDDRTWKIWSLPSGELAMSGEGHKDWLSGVSFHPRGTHLATTSGDGTVKLWDFIQACCIATQAEHTQPTWAVSFHESGNFMASASMDHSCKLWDINSNRCRNSFRGHVDSVNHCSFQPQGNNIVTCSGDKTVSVWDMRTALCVQTFYGHLNSVNCAYQNNKGDTIASCDADGITKLWDIRLVKERATADCGKVQANSLAFDKSGENIAVACDDNLVKLFDKNGTLLHTLRGHDDAVQDVLFDHALKCIITCGSDSTFRIWN